MSVSSLPGLAGKGRDAAFQGTRWSVIARAQDKGSPGAAAALSELCQAYWYPLYAFVRRSGRDHHEAEDLTQGFFEHLVSKDGLAQVDPRKGKFRSFLLGAIKHFMINEWERAHAQKRGGNSVRIEMPDGEERYQGEPANEATPELIYERAWATTVLADALEELRRDYDARGRKNVFDVLSGLMVEPGEGDSYARAAKTLGTTEGNIKVQVFRLRRRFWEVLRARIMQTVASDAEVDDEIRHLMSCFS